jgi:hypothetical protein
LGKNVSYTLLTAGDGSLNEASVYVRLVDVDKREQSQQDLVTWHAVKSRRAGARGIKTGVTPINSFGGLGGRRGARRCNT